MRTIRDQRRPRFQPRPPRPAGPLRVSVVQYLNTAPLVWGLERSRAKRYELSYATPAACADALRKGQVEVGIIPSIEYQSIPGLKVIPGLAIASERKVESVLLVSKGPARRARRVALDSSSRTSAALVKILFARQWKTEPEYFEAPPEAATMLAQADAALLIGDPALRLALHGPHAGLSEISNLHIYDLAEEWWRLTNLPFVFAFWAVRAEAAQPEVAAIFQKSRDHGLQPENLAQIAREWAPRVGLSEAEVLTYLTENIDYSLDAENLAALDYFYQYAVDCGVIAAVPPLQFVGQDVTARKD